MKSRKNILATLLVFSALKIYSSTIISSPGARAAGLGNAAVTLCDVWSTQNNQAGLSRIKTLSASSYFENRFMVKELCINSLSMAIPTKIGVVGLSSNYINFDVYQENKFSLAFAKPFGEQLAIGMQLDYNKVRLAQEYSSSATFTVQAGVIAKLTPKITLGAHLYNPLRSDLYLNQKIPAAMKVGLNYSFNNKVIFLIQTQKISNEKPDFNLGIEYIIFDRVALRTGISSKPYSNTFGIGIKLHKLSIDLASSSHITLGHSPKISLSYTF
jgi:hypothetical protein